MAQKQITAAEQRERERVGATLKTLRLSKGADLNWLSSQMDISYSYLSNIEAGRKPLTDKMLARAAAALGVAQIAIKHPDADLTAATSAPELTA